MFNDFMDLLSFLMLRFMFKDSIDFVFFVDLGVVVDDDEQDLDFLNKLDILQIKTEKKILKKNLYKTLPSSYYIIKNQSKK